MLESIRQWKFGIKLIMGFVVLTFILFYAGSFAGLNRNDPSKYMAAVGAEKIGNIEFQNMFDLMKQQQAQYYQQQGGSLPPEMYDMLRQQTVNSLIDRKLLLIEAK